jgi:hypothetical protein
VLQAERTDLRRRRAYECDAFSFAALRKIGVLAQKAVARMHGRRTVCTRSGEYLVDIEVALRGGSGSDRHRVICELHVQ